MVLGPVGAPKKQLTRKQAEIDLFAFLDSVYETVVAGLVHTLQPDPFYPRNHKLTPNIVGGYIRVWEGICQHELDHFPDYHYRAQQADPNKEVLTRDHFDDLPWEAQLYIAQGIDQIIQEYWRVLEEFKG